MYRTETQCRACKSENLQTVVEFGRTPFADRLLTKDQLATDTLGAPLTLALCTECSLVQILETVDPEVLFYAEYPYFSSVSKSLLAHFRESAEHILTERALDTQSLVIEAASNDGYMLKNFKEQGIPVLGIDPAQAPVAAAKKAGIETLLTFFTKDLARQLRSEGRAADVFLANNVLAHVPDLNGFVAGIATLLKQNGVAVIEAPYIVDLVDHCEFDTIYHQHLCYFSVSALDKLFRRHGLYLNRVKRTQIHGGSLRLFIEPVENVDESVQSLLAREQQAGVVTEKYYLDFAERISRIRQDLMKIITELKTSGHTIAGYGAAAKATTMMSYCGITNAHLDYVADLNPYKHGRFMSGSHLEICEPSNVLQKMPSHLLILAWNFADEIIQQQQEYRAKGGRFIVPIPAPTVI